MKRSALVTTRHDVTNAPDGSLACSCSFRAGAELFGPAMARQVGFAHLANPDLPYETLLAFVSSRPLAETVVAEERSAWRELVDLAKQCAERLADIAEEHDSGTIQLAMDLQYLVDRWEG